MIEQLESRRLMSGDISVQSQDGELRIGGDAFDNAVIIEQSESGAVVVRGEEGTTVNGLAGALTLGGADGLSILVRLRRGDDQLTLRGFDTAASAHIHMGAGDDETHVQSMSLSSTFRFRDSGGRSTSLFDSIELRGPASFATGNAADSLTIRNSDFNGAAKVATDAGGDHIRIRGTTFERNPLIDDGEGDDRVDRQVVFDWDFRHGAQGWVGGFSDHGPLHPEFGGPEFYAFRTGIESLPDETGRVGTAFMMSSANRSSSVFMFLSRRLFGGDGLTARTSYILSFDVRFASHTPGHVGGGGGSPSKSVFVKVGAAPRRLEVAFENQLMLLNVDKGNQAFGGTEMSVAGNVDNGLPDAGPEHGLVYTIVGRKHTHTHPIRTTRAGMLSLVVGTDSGFAGITTLYYTRIRVTLSPVRA
jgi:hypothetical protein